MEKHKWKWELHKSVCATTNVEVRWWENAGRETHRKGKRGWGRTGRGGRTTRDGERFKRVRLETRDWRQRKRLLIVTIKLTHDYYGSCDHQATWWRYNEMRCSHSIKGKVCQCAVVFPFQVSVPRPCCPPAPDCMGGCTLIFSLTPSWRVVHWNWRYGNTLKCPCLPVKYWCNKPPFVLCSVSGLSLALSRGFERRTGSSVRQFMHQRELIVVFYTTSIPEGVTQLLCNLPTATRTWRSGVSARSAAAC